MTYNLCRGPSKCTLERRIDKAMRKLDCIAPSRGVSASLHESVPVETIPLASSCRKHLDQGLPKYWPAGRKWPASPFLVARGTSSECKGMFFSSKLKKLKKLKIERNAHKKQKKNFFICEKIHHLGVYC